MKFKPSDSELVFTQDWSDWLQVGEDVASSSWTSEAGITLDSESNTVNSATVRITGGITGKTYYVRNKIVTNSTPPQTHSGEWYIQIQDELS